MTKLTRCGLLLGLLCTLTMSGQASGGWLFNSSSNYYSGYYPSYYSSYYPTYYGSYYSSYYPAYYGSYYSSYYPSYYSSYYPSYYSSYYYPRYYAGYYSPTYSAGYYSSYYPSYYSSYYTPSYAATYYPTYSYTPSYSVAIPVALSTTLPCAQTPKSAAPAVNTYATPALAPPSQTQEPPAIPAKPPAKPSGTSYGSFYNAALAAGTNGKSADTCKVGFWNLTAKTVTIQVNGETHQVLPNRDVLLVLPRQFVWQLDQQGPQTESVPADRASFEIVLR